MIRYLFMAVSDLSVRLRNISDWMPLTFFVVAIRGDALRADTFVVVARIRDLVAACGFVAHAFPPALVAAHGIVGRVIPTKRPNKARQGDTLLSTAILI